MFTHWMIEEHSKGHNCFPSDDHLLSFSSTNEAFLVFRHNFSKIKFNQFAEIWFTKMI
jgi:hypothetical protein